MKTKRFPIASLWLNRKQPESTRKKRSRAIKALIKKGRWKPWNKNRKLTKQHRENIRASNILKWKNPELKEKMSRIKKQYWTKARKEEQSRRIKEFWLGNPEKLAAMRQKIIQKYKTSDWEKEIGRAVREYYNLKPEARALMRKKQKELYKNHPNMRKERQITSDLYYATHEKERKRFFGYKANKTRYRTALGYVKSKIEKAVLDYLSKPEVYKALLPEYEPFTLYLDSTKPIPDVYLRKIKVIVEIYGGHPKAWKRKVEKNKDYRKAKIPLISITPAELLNLDYCLLKQAIKLGKTQQAKNFKPEKFMKPKPEWLENLRAEMGKIKRGKD
ncbi:MAG: hypothetical protein V1886_02580 [archaeon]